MDCGGGWLLCEASLSFSLSFIRPHFIPVPLQQGGEDAAGAGGSFAEEDDFDEDEEGLGEGLSNGGNGGGAGGINSGGNSSVHREQAQQQQAGVDEETGLMSTGGWDGDGPQPLLPPPADLQQQQRPANGKLCVLAAEQGPAQQRLSCAAEVCSKGGSVA